MSPSSSPASSLSKSPFYPFNLDGPLCPLLADGDRLLDVYERAEARQGIKLFCKRAAWPGKPAVGIAVNPEQLKELLVNLFNTPAARGQLRQHAADGRCPFLHDAIWRWLSASNPSLVNQVATSCEDIKDRLYLKSESLKQLLTKIQTDNPAPQTVADLASVVLAFAMLQPDDRFALGEEFLAAFPQYAAQFCGA